MYQGNQDQGGSMYMEQQDEIASYVSAIAQQFDDPTADIMVEHEQPQRFYQPGDELDFTFEGSDLTDRFEEERLFMEDDRPKEVTRDTSISYVSAVDPLQELLKDVDEEINKTHKERVFEKAN